MADLPTAVCAVCGHFKYEVNHWLVAVSRPGYEGILIQPVEATESPRAENFIYEDLCGQACAHTRLSRCLDDLKAAFTSETEAT